MTGKTKITFERTIKSIVTIFESHYNTKSLDNEILGFMLQYLHMQGPKKTTLVFVIITLLLGGFILGYFDDSPNHRISKNFSRIFK